MIRALVSAHAKTDSRDALGHHKEVLPLTSLMSFFKHMYAIEILYSLSIGCVKFSMLVTAAFNSTNLHRANTRLDCYSCTASSL